MGEWNKKIAIQFDKRGTVYTGRAGLVPVREMMRKMGLEKVLNRACAGMWGESRSENFGYESCALLMMGNMSGFTRPTQIVNSSEAHFFSELLDVEHIPSQSSLSRFISSFEEKNIAALSDTVFQSATKLGGETSGGFRILIHDQSAIQKYGKQMEGVEKGYGGMLKKGSLMLQASLVVDGVSATILNGEIRSGSTHSCSGSCEQLESVLLRMEQTEKDKTLVLSDSAYGYGEYIRTIERHNACFILAIKNDSWLKSVLAQENFKKYFSGVIEDEYGYREFVTSRKSWLPEIFNKDEQELEGLRVIVVKLPVDKGEEPQFQYLVTNLKPDWNSEEVHQLYKNHRESIEIMNDELKNQLGLTELPSQLMNGNRGFSQLIFLAWNLQRIVERVGLEKQRKKINEKEKESAKISKNIEIRNKVQALKSRLQRYEWWTLFVKFISVGGKYTSASRQRHVVVSANEAFQEWYESLMQFEWKSFALI